MEVEFGVRADEAKQRKMVSKGQAQEAWVLWARQREAPAFTGALFGTPRGVDLLKFLGFCEGLMKKHLKNRDRSCHDSINLSVFKAIVFGATSLVLADLFFAAQVCRRRLQKQQNPWEGRRNSHVRGLRG